MARFGEEAPREVAFDRLGRRALVIVVVAAILAAVGMSRDPVSSPASLGIVLLGLVYLAVLMFVGERLERSASAPRRFGYLLVQLALAAAILGLQAWRGSFGVAWIVLLPLLVQGQRMLARGGLGILVVAILLLPVIHVRALAGWGEAASAALGVGAGILFVLLFSAVTLRERAARSRSEILAEELGEANRRLAALYASAQEVAVERERNRLAREIHDTLGHALTVIHVQLQSVKLLVPSDPSEAVRRVDQAAELARQGLTELRGSVRALRTSPDGRSSLEDRIRRLCHHGDGVGVEPGFELAGEPRPLASESGEALFRAAQEALTNLRRHARARTARVTLDFRQPDRVILAVADDGRGAASTEGGFGLTGIRERIQMTGGRMTIATAPGAGFRLTVEVPT